VEEVLGTTVFSLLKPEGIEHVKAVNAKRLEDEKAGIKTDVIRYELEQICKDGSYIWTEINVNPYRDANGTFIGYYGVTRDISERKRAETAIDDLNRELDLRLKERTAQLELVSQELASTSYSMAHTLRTPLRALDGFSYILLEEYENVLDAQGQDYLKRIRAASHRMGLLTDNLIRLLAITRSDLAMTEVNLSRLAQNYIKVLSTSQPERKVNFDCADDMVVQGDPYLMSVLIENLLDNAWKFTRECATAHITLGQYMQEGKPVFFVEDNGVGFDMAYVKKLFGNFQRLHAPDAYEGTGIGLAIVKRIILRHGGRIWAESKVNQGSTFYFTIG